VFLCHSADGERRDVYPGQELVEPVDGVAVGEPREHVGEIGLGIDGVELAGLDERGEDRPVLAAAIRGDLMMPGVWGTR
jgi:hypothetical protein